MADSKTPLEANHSYHIYNHAVGNDTLFQTDSNYYFFLEGIRKYLLDYLDVYSYCLLPNHFHLLVGIKSIESITDTYYRSHPNKHFDTNLETPMILSRQFSHLFNSYAQSFNKENGRKGSLFYNRFKRKLVNNEEYFRKLVLYIHKNPVEHGIVKAINAWEYSSYNTFLFNVDNMINKEFVLEQFYNLENFKFCHTI